MDIVGDGGSGVMLNVMALLFTTLGLAQEDRTCTSQIRISPFNKLLVLYVRDPEATCRALTFQFTTGFDPVFCVFKEKVKGLPAQLGNVPLIRDKVREGTSTVLTDMVRTGLRAKVLLAHVFDEIISQLT